MKYKYIGQIKINLIGYGEVNPEEIIDVGWYINNPLFVRVKDEKKKEKRS
jgi:hypothetical protein